MTFVERAAESEVLDGLLSECLTTRGRVVLVTGAMGTGKTELLQMFANRAHEQGAVLLSAVGSAAERDLPLGVMHQLFDAAVPARGTSAENAAAVRQLLAGTLSALGELWPAEPPGSMSIQLLQTLCRAVLDLAAGSPVVISIDDVDQADVPSLQCLLYLARRLRPARALMVLTENSSRPGGYPGFRNELLGQSHVRRLRLSPLSEQAVSTLIEAQFGAAAATRHAGPAHTLTGGNPLLLSALLEDHLAGGDPHPVTPVPGPAFRYAVDMLVTRCAPPMRRAVRALAVIGGDTPDPLVGQLIEVGPEEIRDQLNALSATGLLGPEGERFRHPAIRAAVRHGIPAAEGIALHRQAAEALHTRGAESICVAEHLVATNDPGIGWAVPVLRAAAERSLVLDDVDLAVRCLKLALRSGCDDRERGAVMTLLVRAQWRLDPSTVLQNVGQLLPALHSGQGWGRHALALTRYLLWHGRCDDAVDALTIIGEALTGVDEPGDSEIADELRIVRLVMSSSFPAVLPRVPRRPMPVDTRQLLPSGVSLRLHAAGGLATVLSDGADEATLNSAEWVLESAGLNDSTLDPLTHALLTLVYADRLDKATPWCETLLAEARSRQAVTWQAVFLGIQAEITLRQGHLADAEENAAAALDAISPQSWGLAIGAPLATLVLTAVARGDYDLAAAQLRRPIPDSIFSSRYGLLYLYARGRYHLATDRLHAALGDFETCGNLMQLWQIDLPSLVPWRSGVAQAWLGLGRTDDARRLIGEELALNGQTDSRTRGMSLRLLAAASELRRRPQLLREAVEVLQRHGDRLELARALTDLSQAHRALGDVKLARILLSRADQVAKECQAQARPQAVSSPATFEKPRISASFSFTPEGIESLSPSERRVAELAALGYTNREIAGKLYVTVSTVEQHLTRVYRKLDVRRKDLLQGLEFPKVYSA